MGSCLAQLFLLSAAQSMHRYKLGLNKTLDTNTLPSEERSVRGQRVDKLVWEEKFCQEDRG